MRHALWIVSAAAFGALQAGTARAQCPTAGADTGCGSIITVSPTGATVTQTGMGPYDGNDDTLIGVVNNSRVPIYSLDLTSVNNIFGFDGDGIDTYGVAGNAQDSTGYGGPNAYFSNINSAQTYGRVNFINPIMPGATDFFSLENVLQAAAGCTTALNNSVPSPTVTGRFISDTFTPQGTDPNTGHAYTLAAAATACGFIEFDWQQTITTLPTPLPGNAFNAIATPSLPPTTPFNDPPPSGYVYMLPVPPGPLDAPQLSVYWDPFNGPNDASANGSFALAAHTNTAANTVTWSDAPADSCLPGSQSSAVAAYADQVCGGPGVRAPAGSLIQFTTHLVGLAGALPGAAVIDTGIGFTWTSNFNGTTGGTAVLPTLAQNDAGSGSGGYAVTSYTATTSYNGVGVAAINGSPTPFGPSPLLAAVLPASRSVQVNATATAFATIINAGSTAATGCSIAPAGSPPLTFHYQTTNPLTNATTGTIDTAVGIAAGASQSFVISLTPTATISPAALALNFSCAGVTPAPIYTGINTLLLSGSTTPTPDVIALGATASNDGILHLPGVAGAAAFAVATYNLGSADTITVTPTTAGATLPLAISICQTTSGGQCISAPAASVTTTIATNATPTFGIFGTASAAIPFDAVNNRIFVQFTDSGGAVRGSTSVAVETQ